MTEWMSPSYNILLRSHHVKSSQIKLWNILKVTEIDQSSRLNLCCVMKLFLTNERLQVWILAPLKCQYLKTWNNLQQPMIIIISVISTNMGKKEVNTIYSSFQLKERLNFRINLATAIDEKIQAETVEQLEALQMIKMELSSAAKCWNGVKHQRPEWSNVEGNS